jgi:hypothetical protein
MLASAILVLLLNAFAVQIASDLTDGIYAVTAGWACWLRSWLPRPIILQVIFGTNDDDTTRFGSSSAWRAGGAKRPARGGTSTRDRRPGIARVAARDGTPTMARWLSGGFTDWSSGRPTPAQTGASQADPAVERGHPAFRWVEKESGRSRSARRPRTAPIERRRGGGRLLATGPAAATCSGEAEEVILTVSRIEAEKRESRVPGVLRGTVQFTRASPCSGGRAIEDGGLTAARRACVPGPSWRVVPLIRAAMCVVVATLIVMACSPT